MLTLPRALAAGIRFDPALPGDHALLLHQIPAGTEVKTVALYEEPFWRADGISGNTVATDDLIEVTLDTTQPAHPQGVVGTYSAGPRARALWRMGESERRAALVRMLATRLGPKAARPLEVLELNWAEERWTRGLLDGALPHRRTHPVRPPAARARGPDPLGRHRDGIDLLRRDGRRGALGRARLHGDPGLPGLTQGPIPSGRGPGPAPTPSFSRKNVNVWSSAARVGVPSWSTRCSVRTECACLGCA